MRVKVLLALAIASILLISSMGVAMANILPSCISGVPTLAALQNSADNQVNSGMCDCGSADDVGSVSAVPDVGNADDCIGSCGLQSPICGVNGSCPDCNVTDNTTVFGGPDVNLTCPVVNAESAPVNLETPALALAFPSVNLAPTADVTLPQVNLGLNCFDISCCPSPTPTPTHDC
ncbi:MAG TPA: hypothetical protein VK436_04915 [Methanocella sp.]|nr:hypothetical protein [Methanocella sp.]